MKVDDCVESVRDVIPLRSYELINGCGDDMCDCSDYHNEVKSIVLVSRDEFKIIHIEGDEVTLEDIYKDHHVVTVNVLKSDFKQY